MEVKTETKYLRISPRKVRLVVDAIKNLTPVKALAYLKFVNKRAAKPISKIIQSAIANAKNNFALKPEDLKFKEIQVGEGPTLKRWRAVSRGRAHRVMKRTSHIKIILESKNKK